MRLLAGSKLLNATIVSRNPKYCLEAGTLISLAKANDRAASEVSRGDGCATKEQFIIIIKLQLICFD